MFDIPMSSSGPISFGTPQADPPQPAPMQAQPAPMPQAVPPQSMPQPAPMQSMQPAPMQAMQSAPSTGVILKKGQKVSLVSLAGSAGLALPAGGLQKVKVGLGWNLVNQACDLDASAFMLDANGRVVGDDWFVFYGQPTSPDGSIMHSGDSDGTGPGDDETMTVDLTRVNPAVQKIVFVVTIDEALQKHQNFSMVQNAYVRVESEGTELLNFKLTEYYSNVTAMVVAELYRHNGEWKFNAVGDGTATDLAGLCMTYGVNVAG